MWVRSQDKNLLINCNDFRIVKGECLLKGKFIIKYETNFLGIYSTEEKTIKVLDMIEGAIHPTEFPHHIYPIFQMPTDEDV